MLSDACKNSKNLTNRLYLKKSCIFAILIPKLHSMRYLFKRFWLMLLFIFAMMGGMTAQSTYVHVTITQTTGRKPLMTCKAPVTCTLKKA